MFKTIFVPLTGLQSDVSALETAFLLGRLFDSRIECLYVRVGARQLLSEAAAGDAVSIATPVLLKDLADEELARKEDAKNIFLRCKERWNLPVGEEPLLRHGLCASWTEIEGDATDQFVHAARFADLVVLGRSTDGEDLADAGFGEVIMKCGKPVIVAPVHAAESLAPTIAIAWKETAESARAVSAALPLLLKANRIFVMAANENGSEDAMQTMASAEKLAIMLRRHGLDIEVRLVMTGVGTVPNAILKCAKDVGAELLVMGAYGHSRAREFVFGGFTRHILKTDGLPVLLIH